MITLDAVLTAPATLAVGATLLHFLWQGAAIAVLLVAIVEIGRIRSVQRRYNCSLAALALVIVMPLATFGWLAARSIDRVRAQVVRRHAVVLRRRVVRWTNVEACDWRGPIRKGGIVPDARGRHGCLRWERRSEHPQRSEQDQSRRSPHRSDSS